MGLAFQGLMKKNICSCRVGLAKWSSVPKARAMLCLVPMQRSAVTGPKKRAPHYESGVWAVCGIGWESQLVQREKLSTDKIWCDFSRGIFYEEFENDGWSGLRWAKKGQNEVKKVNIQEYFSIRIYRFSHWKLPKKGWLWPRISKNKVAADGWTSSWHHNDGMMTNWQPNQHYWSRVSRFFSDHGAQEYKGIFKRFYGLEKCLTLFFPLPPCRLRRAMQG